MCIVSCSGQDLQPSLTESSSEPRVESGINSPDSGGMPNDDSFVSEIDKEDGIDNNLTLIY